MLLDPQTTEVTLLSLDETGRLELRFRSDPGFPTAPGAVIIIPAQDREYRHVVRALEQVRLGGLDLDLADAQVWLAAPQ